MVPLFHAAELGLQAGVMFCELLWHFVIRALSHIMLCQIFPPKEGTRMTNP